jgi:hypothetical protein
MFYFTPRWQKRRQTRRHIWDDLAPAAHAKQAGQLFYFFAKFVGHTHGRFTGWVIHSYASYFQP